jgi:hypothetical protein
MIPLGPLPGAVVLEQGLTPLQEGERLLRGQHQHVGQRARGRV